MMKTRLLNYSLILYLCENKLLTTAFINTILSTYQTAERINDMKKMSTLYKKDPNDLGRVINEVNPENAWVFESGIPTRKYDGTSFFAS